MGTLDAILARRHNDPDSRPAGSASIPMRPRSETLLGKIGMGSLRGGADRQESRPRLAHCNSARRRVANRPAPPPWTVAYTAVVPYPATPLYRRAPGPRSSGASTLRVGGGAPI